MRVALVVVLAVLLSQMVRADAEPEREYAIRIQGLAGDGPATDAPVGGVPIGTVQPIPGGAE